jgi:hypothetical protein
MRCSTLAATASMGTSRHCLQTCEDTRNDNSRQTMLDATALTGAILSGNSVANNLVFPTVLVNFPGVASPYSLASVQTYTLRVGTTINATSNMSVGSVSAPGTIALAGLALAGLGLMMRKKASAQV